MPDYFFNFASYMVHTSNKGILQVPNDLVDTKSKLYYNAMMSND